MFQDIESCFATVSVNVCHLITRRHVAESMRLYTSGEFNVLFTDDSWFVLLLLQVVCLLSPLRIPVYLQPRSSSIFFLSLVIHLKLGPSVPQQLILSPSYTHHGSKTAT
jgi:hypothetical protein